MTTFGSLIKKHNLKIVRKNYPTVFSKKVNHKELSDEVTKLILTLGSSPWKTIEGIWYSGLGLTYDSYQSTDKYSQVLGDYENPYFFDAMRFNTVIPEATRLFEILDIPLTPIRSRIAIIDGEYEFKRDDGWHIDESVHENLRLNIPIITSEDFVFQLDNQSPQHFETDKGYWWDTKIPHRVFSLKKNTAKRVHLVLGFSPWFSYINNEWIPNEFFNKTYPLDILGSIK